MQFRRIPGVGRTLLRPAGALAAAIAAAGVFAFVPERGVAIAAVSAALFGLFEVARAVRQLVARRREADDWLRSSTGRVVPSAYRWRAEQLVSACQRRMLARSLRVIVQRSSESPRPNFVPRLIAARKVRTSLEALAGTLELEREPVTPAGVLRVVELVTDGAGPLWGSSEEALADEIQTTLRVLRAA